MTPKDTLLSKLQDPEFNFVLCGSQFFHTSNLKSDYDFFAAESSRERLQPLLFELGFIEYFSEYQLDDECTYLLRHEEHKVDIIFQKNLELSKRVRDILYSTIPDFGYIDEQVRGYIWRAMKKACREGMKLHE